MLPILLHLLTAHTTFTFPTKKPFVQVYLLLFPLRRTLHHASISFDWIPTSLDTYSNNNMETLGRINDRTLVTTEAQALSQEEIIFSLNFDDVSQFMTALSTGSGYIRLPSNVCDQPGIESAVAWIKNVSVDYKQIAMPTDISDAILYNLLDLCSMEYALHVLGLLSKSRIIRIMICNCLDVELHISQVIQAWERVPNNSVWADMILHHIGRRLASKNNNIIRHGHCMCGWKHTFMQEDHTCIPIWVYQDNYVRNALGRIFSDAECVAMFPRFGMHCRPKTRKWIKKWALQANDYTDMPVSQLPHQNGEFPTIHKTGPIHGAVQLEFIGHTHLDHTDGGYFIETTPSQPWSGRSYRTDVSHNWLASRVHGYDSSSRKTMTGQETSSSHVERADAPGNVSTTESITFPENWWVDP